MRDLLEHGYEPLNVDRTPPRQTYGRFQQADLTDLGQTFECLHGADGVVHLAAIPAPGRFTAEFTFRINNAITYNVFTAAVTLGLQRVVWASSETVLGLPFDREKPIYAPIDEAHPLYPESSYALSKVLSEEMARQMNRWSGIPFVGLRFSNIKEVQQYQEFPDYWDDPTLRKWNLWGYVDARDVAQSCRLGLEADLQGAEVYIIAAADTVMKRPNHELMAEVFPGVPLSQGMGDFETLLSIAKARRMLGYDPEFSWRDHV
jgi:nucleoside-diphosphate-sugar epimerase